MSRPWMPLYISDYLGDTTHLSTTEHGAYLLLMMYYWQHGSLPDDDDRLARIAGSMRIEDWRSIRPTIQSFFHSGWCHDRIEEELEKSRVRARAGRQGGRPKAKEKQNESKLQSKTEAPQPQSQEVVSGGSSARARPPTEAFALALEIGQVAGYPDASYWPPGWSHAGVRVQMMLDRGWRREVILAAARAAMVGRKDDPPYSIGFFEKPIARAHARANAPLPDVSANGQREIPLPQIVGGTDETTWRSSAATTWQQRRDAARDAVEEFSERLRSQQASLSRSGGG